MLDGKELEGTIGEYGSYFVDVQDVGVVEAGVSLKFDVIAALRKLAQKTTNSLDDKAVDVLESLLRKKPDSAV